MTSSPSPTAIRFDDAQMWVELDDGRTLGVPLVWFPRLLRGSPAERADFFLSPSGVHWDALDEDISVAGLLAGRGDMTAPHKSAARAQRNPTPSHTFLPHLHPNSGETPMQPVTIDDRKKELKVLLQQMQEQPSRDWSEQRQRAAVLTEMIAASERGEGLGQQRG